MNTVWITRTDAHKSIRLPPGFQALNIPLLTVGAAARPPEPPKSDDVLVFTSGNGVRWFCTYSDRRNWPVYTVGYATKDLAKRSGFNAVESAGKDVATLTQLIANTPALKSKRLYYASGLDVSGDLEADLKRDGFNIVRAILYETHPKQKVPKQVRATLAKHRAFTVLLYSPKGAQAFGALDIDFRRISTVSISANVDQNLSGLGLKSRKIANFPTHAALIKQLT